MTPDADPLELWLAALDERHLADLTPSEVARALRALSSCYVERRATLASGGALESAGKRAAFALFYAPLHFLVVRHIVRALGGPLLDVGQITDLGCGTGVAGAAWALEALPHKGGSHDGGGNALRVRLTGIDRHPWAVAEANWTYRQLGVAGRARQGDVARIPIRAQRGTGVIAAYTLNELPGQARERLLAQLVAASEHGAHVLIVEPIARRLAAWWDAWVDAFRARGGRSDEWRFDVDLPARPRDLARAAGLDPHALTAKSLFLAPDRASHDFRVHPRRR